MTKKKLKLKKRNFILFVGFIILVIIFLASLYNVIVWSIDSKKTDEVIEKVLAPFNDEKFYGKPEGERVRPAFTWDWYSLGGRYGGLIKLRVDMYDEKYEWRYIGREPRNGRLFRSALLDTINNRYNSRWDAAYYENYHLDYMGFRDAFLYVDAALADDIQNISDMSCYCFVDQNGNAFARDYFNEEGFVTNEDFDTQLSNAKENSSGCYICVVDLHD